jgi:hypothetical protein
MPARIIFVMGTMPEPYTMAFGEAFIQSVDGHGLRQDKASQKQVDDRVGTLTCHGNFSAWVYMDSLPVL